MQKDAYSRLKLEERGAVKIQVVLTFLALAIVAFVVIRVAPVYFDERQVIYRVEEVANKATVRNSKEKEITTEIERIRQEFSLPEGAIKLTSREENRTRLVVNYSVTIDFLVTTYSWQVDRAIEGKGF
ncbi:MAG TPA: hypothetical protein VJH03_24855 [Blastocatellia bacterium]|nr:hypothetical protein [Blastocatellia bacterium]